MPLVDAIQSLLDDEVIARLAAVLGETAGATRQGLVAGAIPAVLNGLARRYGVAGGGDALAELLQAGAHDGGMLTNLAGAFGGGAYTDVLLNVGKGRSAGLLGDRADAVVDLVANTTGLRRSSTSSLLGLAAPLVLAAIGRQRIQQNLDGGALQTLLATLKSQLRGIAMPGLATALGVAELGSLPGATPVKRSLAPWIIVPTVLLAAGWALNSCQQQAMLAPLPTPLHATTPTIKPLTKPAPPPVVRPASVVASTVTPAAAAAQETPRAAGPTTAPMETPAVAAPAAAATEAPPPAAVTTTPRPLAEITASVDKDSVAYELALFLADPSSAAPRSFVLRDLNFDLGTAEISRSSHKALADVATVLKSYGKARVMLQGHTDNSGDASANYDLSLSRARAAQKALVDLGVSAARLSTAGFGADRPLQSNATAAGRAHNRRTELLITVK